MSEVQPPLFPTFGDNFLAQHAGSIISEPKYALVELVANTWDAGSDEVKITFPETLGGDFEIADNGSGMTKEEFLTRWNELNYNREAQQGKFVEYPIDSGKRKRKPYGHNGVGRHAVFCFSDVYYVETAKDGYKTKVKVTKSVQGLPFQIEIISHEISQDRGTKIYAKIERSLLSLSDVEHLIGSKFIADPKFTVYLNNNKIIFENLSSFAKNWEIPFANEKIIVSRFDSLSGRTSQQSGVAWWVNKRLVGIPSWEIDEEFLIDARTATAKRLLYIVEVDFLKEVVKPDWSGFHSSVQINEIRRVLSESLREDLNHFRSEINRERKREALSINKDQIRALPLESQQDVARFVSEIQNYSPSISVKDLGYTVKVFANLEKARSGFSLLERLSNLNHDDLDNLDTILSEWSISDAKKVLGELRYRLTLIQKLEKLVESHEADELHDLQPLFDRGLWIFGPKFESISFTSNRTLVTVLRNLLQPATLNRPSDRPDFVILPDSSIGLYSCDAFDASNEVSGVSEVIILELKRGGFQVTLEEKDQANKYAREIRRSGKVGQKASITCYVLGTEVDIEASEELVEGHTLIITKTYSSVLKTAHARTFNLLTKLETSSFIKNDFDPELNEVMGDPSLFN